MKPNTYGLNPGQLAALKRKAKINQHSIVMQANTPEALRLCNRLFDALKTDKAVYISALRPNGTGYALVKHKKP